MATAVATGRQIMQGIHPLWDGSAFDVHAAKCGSKALEVSALGFLRGDPRPAGVMHDSSNLPSVAMEDAA